MKPVRFSVDVGYAQTKWCIELENGSIETSTFSSALAIATPKSVNGAAEALETYMYHGQIYLCGDLATRPHVQEQINSREETHLIKYAPIYVAAAARAVGICLGEIDILNVGLPYEMYRPYSCKLREVLSSFSVNGEGVIPTLNIYCQGAAAVFSAQIEQGLNEGDNLLIDIGGNAMTCVAARGGTAIALGTKQYGHLGMFAAAEQLATQLSDGTICSKITAAEALKTRVFQGKDISNMIDHILFNYATSIVAALENKYGPVLDDLNTIILSGGGAVLIAPFIPEKWSSRVMLQPDPITANVRGYHYRSHLA